MRHRNEFIQHLVKSFVKLRQEFLKRGMTILVTVLVTVLMTVLALVFRFLFGTRSSSDSVLSTSNLFRIGLTTFTGVAGVSGVSSCKKLNK